FTLNGTSAVYTTGLVGIGTNTPDSQLHVLGSVSNGTVGALKVADGTHTLVLDGSHIDSSGPLSLNSFSATDVILVQGSGKVGVGTPAPDSKLHIVGPVSNGIVGAVKIADISSTLVMDGSHIDSLAPLAINGFSPAPVVIGQGGGNVGIGTFGLPTCKLDVN